MNPFDSCSFVVGLSPERWRLDITGRLICRDDYGNRNQFGWVIDESVGLALHWQSFGDGF